MKILIEKGNPGEPVNICTGKAYKIQEILDLLVKISGTEVKIVSDPALMRVADEPLLLGDARKIKGLGFSPKYTIEQTLTEVFCDWMERI